MKKANQPTFLTNSNFQSPLSKGSFDTVVALTNDKTSVDLQDLDVHIRSMITKSEVSAGNRQGKIATCNICGKQGPFHHMTQHIEANHITGVSHSCDLCGKVSRSRNALGVHKINMHDHSQRKLVTGPEVI